MSLVYANQLSKTYQMGEVSVEALHQLNFSIQPKSFVAFVGPSGSGKSTVLNLVGCLDKPSQGELKVLGTDVTLLNSRQLAHFRGEHLGFVFQDFNLIPVLTVAENIEYPLTMVQDWLLSERKARVEELLAAIGMSDQADKRPDQLSGGQKQRVAVARALATRPKLVLADEPTANLDHDTAYRIINLMKTMRDELGTTFIFSTHDTKLVGEAEVVLNMEDGRLKNGQGGV